MNPVTLSDPSVGPGLLLRRLETGDAQSLFEAARESIATVGRWLPWCHAGYSIHDAQGWIAACAQAWASDSGYPFGVFEVDGDNSRLVGSVAINQIHRLHRFANLGYWLRSGAQGRGLASRATRTAARFGFGTLALQRLEIIVEPDNLASRAVALRVGARYEGLARRRLRIGAANRDAAIYGLIDADLSDARPNSLV